MNNSQLKFQFEVSNNKIYEIDDIWNSAVYAKELVIKYLLKFYYLIFWKNYSKKENTWQPKIAI